MTLWCKDNECVEEKRKTICKLCKLKTAKGLLGATKASHLDNIVKKKRNINGKNKPQPPCFIFTADKKWSLMNWHLITA